MKRDDLRKLDLDLVLDLRQRSHFALVRSKDMLFDSASAKKHDGAKFIALVR